jgi:CRISPR-associated endonuclease Cas3-HD
MELFWAKTPSDSDVAPHWNNIHSVFHHCVDVGLVAERLLQTRWRSLLPVLQQMYSDADEALLATVVTAATHDLGKISWWFQAKVESLIVRLIEAGYERPRGTELQHGHVTTLYLSERFQRDWPDIDPDIPGMFAQASGCHHGSYFPIGDPELLSNADAWARERDAHFDALVKTWFVGQRHFPEPNRENPGPEWTMLVAGLISVADWIGSSLSFPVEVTDYPEYLYVQRQQIDARLHETGVTLHV